MTNRKLFISKVVKIRINTKTYSNIKDIQDTYFIGYDIKTITKITFDNKSIEQFYDLQQNK